MENSKDRIIAAMRVVAHCEHLVNRHGTAVGWYRLASIIEAHYPGHEVDPGELCRAVTFLNEIGCMRTTTTGIRTIAPQKIAEPEEPIAKAA